MDDITRDLYDLAKVLLNYVDEVMIKKWWIEWTERPWPIDVIEQNNTPANDEPPQEFNLVEIEPDEIELCSFSNGFESEQMEERKAAHDAK